MAKSQIQAAGHAVDGVGVAGAEVPLEHGPEFGEEDAAPGEFLPVPFLREVRRASEHVRATPDGVVEGLVLERVKGVVVDEDADRPLRRQQLGASQDRLLQAVGTGARGGGARVSLTGFLHGVREYSDSVGRSSSLLVYRVRSMPSQRFRTCVFPSGAGAADGKLIPARGADTSHAAGGESPNCSFRIRISPVSMLYIAPTSPIFPSWRR